MSVIGHEAVGPNFHTIFMTGFFQKISVGKEIIIPEKNIKSAIAPLDNMVRITRSNYSCDSWHSRVMVSFLVRIATIN